MWTLFIFWSDELLIKDSSKPDDKDNKIIKTRPTNLDKL